jgi:hypothetical protein
MDENMPKYMKIIKKGNADIDEGKSNQVKEFLRLGEEARSDQVLKILEIQEPPNAQSTKDQKGSSKPLVNTGKMKDDVKFRGIIQGKKIGGK